MTEYFTCRELNWRGHGDTCNRWAIDGPCGEPDDFGDGKSYEGSFPDEATARETAKRWNETGGEAVRIGWQSAVTDSDHDRGTYHITVRGTRYRRVTCGWGGMDEAAAIARELRDRIAKYGLEAVVDILGASK